MSYPARLLIFAAAVLLAGCAGNVRKPGPSTVERVVTQTVKVYVPIDKRLTKRGTIASGALHEMPKVARDRKKSLEMCYGQLETIEKVQGTPVPDEPR